MSKERKARGKQLETEVRLDEHDLRRAEARRDEIKARLEQATLDVTANAQKLKRSQQRLLEFQVEPIVARLTPGQRECMAREGSLREGGGEVHTTLLRRKLLYASHQGRGRWIRKRYYLTDKGRAVQRVLQAQQEES